MYSQALQAVRILPSLVAIFFVMGMSACGKYYRLCNDTCVMLGSYAGTTYDEPCADNVSFMVTHIADGRSFCSYQEEFSSQLVLPSLPDLPTSMAMHEPIYPGVTGTSSEDILFSLQPFSRGIESAELYVRMLEVSADVFIEGPYVVPALDNAAAKIQVSWGKSAFGFVRTINKAMVGSTATSNETEIEYKTPITGLSNNIILITYKFDVVYESVAGASESMEDRREIMEVTFSLQNFHQLLPDQPAPIYAQGSKDDLIDIIFIPARSHHQTEHVDGPTMIDFRLGAGLLIKDAFFQEPTLRFWRSQFNFWINKHDGRANDFATCHECCHDEPAFFENIDDLEVKALLYKGDQVDLTDPCSELFSAEMDVSTNNAFLHELGHAAFELRDEYAGGWNGQEFVLNLPNNWNSKSAAKNDAVFRHKLPDDAKKLR